MIFCCGSGAITLGLVQAGISPERITMVDVGGFGTFWGSISKNSFDLTYFKSLIDALPPVDKLQSYLEQLSRESINPNLMVYHYLLMQSGAFGGKQIGIDQDKWTNTSFRSYWQPTETSKRRSVVNPMMPLPLTLYNRVELIVNQLGGKVIAYHMTVEDFVYKYEIKTPAIIYIDPPYLNTTHYQTRLDIDKLLPCLPKDTPIYISEGRELDQAVNIWGLSSRRKKGNMNGNLKRLPWKKN